MAWTAQDMAEMHAKLKRAEAQKSDLEKRVAKLERWAHEPFDFTELCNRIERLEDAVRKLNPGLNI